VCIAAALLFAVLFFFIFRSLRIPKDKKARRKRPTLLQRLKSSLSRRRDGRSPLSTIEVQNVSTNAETAVDRHTSVRSVATLPAYSAVPRDGEGVIGREGDREGMDTVVEFPETAEEQEARREDEMESLWRIRQQRREEAAEREERRRRRREARERGDHATLNALRNETVLRTTYRHNNGSAALIADHNSRPRERRVSAVSYGDLGVARHDGSRVRANSNESDIRPLLDGAADMAGPVRPWVSRENFSTHHRTTSATSVLSMSSVDSNERPRIGPDGSDLEVISLQQTQSSNRPQSLSRPLTLQSSQSTTPVDADLGDNRIPLPDPPQYDSMGFEEAPPYEQSMTPSLSPDPPASTPYSQIPQLPTIDRLPSIRISEPSPVDPPPHRPISESTRPTTSTIHE